MKKTLQILLFSIFALGINAQDFTLTPDVLEYEFSGLSDKQQIGLTITNNGDSASDWYWSIERGDDFPAEWEIQVCDQVLCWSWGTEEFPVDNGIGINNLAAGQSTIPSAHYVKVDNKGVAGKGSLRFCVYGDDAFSNQLICSELSTATTEIDTKDISIFPNPTNDYFELSGGNSISNVEIYNIVGKKVAAFTHVVGSHIDVSDLRNGLYVVRVLDRGGKVVKSMRLSKR